MKFTIDTEKKTIVLASDEKFNINKISEWASAHGLSDYEIYVISEIVGKIRPEVAEEFAERWRKIMEENKGAFKWFPKSKLVIDKISDQQEKQV